MNQTLIMILILISGLGRANELGTLTDPCPKLLNKIVGLIVSQSSSQAYAQLGDSLRFRNFLDIQNQEFRVDTPAADFKRQTKAYAEWLEDLNEWDLALPLSAA